MRINLESNKIGQKNPSTSARLSESQEQVLSLHIDTRQYGVTQRDMQPERSRTGKENIAVLASVRCAEGSEE